jgi:hypothetical protein
MIRDLKVFAYLEHFRSNIVPNDEVQDGLWHCCVVMGALAVCWMVVAAVLVWGVL